jgi:YbgC/YbaW family acyl-CoA thioester hydrolase
MAFTFVVQKQVEFSETDMAGIVHFSNFFRMMEAAEHAFLRSLGVSVHSTGPAGTTGWPRVKASCDYRKPLRFEETVAIELSIAEVRSRSVCYRFVFRRESGEEVAVGELVVVHAKVDPEKRVLEASPIPEPLKSWLMERVTPLASASPQPAERELRTVGAPGGTIHHREA